MINIIIQILKIPFYILWVLSHIIAFFILLITYPYFKIRYKLKPNLNNRPFIYRGKLVKFFTYWIDYIFSRIL